VGFILEKFNLFEAGNSHLAHYLPSNNNRLCMSSGEHGETRLTSIESINVV